MAAPFLLKGNYGALPWLLWNERRSSSAIRALQERKLLSLVRHAYERVPIYRELYDQAGVAPGDVRSLDDIALLPTISKSDLRGRGRDRLDQRIDRTDDLVCVKTSGSSGVPLDILIDRGYDQFRKAQYLRPYLTNGRRLTDRLLRFCAFGDDTPKWFERVGLLREHRVEGDSDIDGHLERIRNLAPDVLQGYGSELALIAREIEARGLDLPQPRLVFTDSELLTQDVRRSIEKAFGVPVLDVYGSFEVDNVGYECAAHAGYHLAEDCVVAEFLDPDGRPVPEGEEGELTFTALHNFTMPFIRYRTGDMGAFTSEPCPCGRTMRRMTHIAGRVADYMVDSAGRRRSSTALFVHFYDFGERLREFQIAQTARQRFEVRIVPASTADHALDAEIRGRMLEDLPGAVIDVVRVTAVPRSPANKWKPFVQQIAQA